MTSTRKYRPSDNPSATKCLIKAFSDDPLFKKMCEYSSNDWHGFATRAFSWTNYMMAASYDMAEVVVDDNTGEIICVADWELPNMTVMMLLRGIIFAFVILLTDGWCMLKCYVRVMDTLEKKRHELAPTAHHLQVLGAAVQGKGVGSKLIKVGIERAEKAGVPCYLESSNVKNIPFYERHGFQVLEELFLFEDKNTGEKGPPATLMIRKPQQK